MRPAQYLPDTPTSQLQFFHTSKKVLLQNEPSMLLKTQEGGLNRFPVCSRAGHFRIIVPSNNLRSTGPSDHGRIGQICRFEWWHLFSPEARGLVFLHSLRSGPNRRSLSADATASSTSC